MTFKDKESEFGTETQQKKSGPHKAIRVTDLDYADDQSRLSKHRNPCIV